ncbi:MAG: hypothetical protein N2545_10925 [Thermoflexales bacterium]|nr:hypothetical protein [Thermoflexales bacterium]
MKYICNSLSINMFASAIGDKPMHVTIERVSTEAAEEFALSAKPAIGHADTARLVARQIAPQREDEFVAAAAQRPTLNLTYGDELLVAQYVGPRLPEGATELPPDARIEYFLVSF